jgi:hypothetical protein
MNEGRRRGGRAEDHVIRIKLPQARVIYWEATTGTPERESIVFMFPGGQEYRYDVPSVKFSEYSVKELEEEGLGLLLPFCVMKYRHEVERAKGGEERKKLAALVEGLVEDVVGAAERSVGGGGMGESDAGNVVLFTKILWEELYQVYTEFKEEGKMWEHIKVVDFDSLWKERDEAKRQVEEAKRQADEAKHQAEETKRQAEEAKHQVDEVKRQVKAAIRRAEELSRERETAIRKLMEAGVSREQLATAGLLETAAE